jgi:hypothetical protein
MQHNIEGAGRDSATPKSDAVVSKYPPSFIGVPNRGIYRHTKEQIRPCEPGQKMT